MTAPGIADAQIRWLIDPPADGPTNMARDEAILTCVGRGTAPPTLRFYRWDAPTVSLGYFQAYADFAALPPPAGSMPVVRRTTGGGAILHDQEITYSLTLPLSHPLIRPAGPNTLYDHVHGAVADRLGRHGLRVDRAGAGGRCSHGGPFFCFERHACFDLLAGGRKIMGSAQRRTTRAVLQQGSLVLARRYEQQVCAAVTDLGAVDADALIRELAEAIAGASRTGRGSYTAEEIDLAAFLRARYADAAWTRRR